MFGSNSNANRHQSDGMAVLHRKSVLTDGHEAVNSKAQLMTPRKAFGDLKKNTGLPIGNSTLRKPSLLRKGIEEDHTSTKLTCSTPASQRKVRRDSLNEKILALGIQEHCDEPKYAPLKYHGMEWEEIMEKLVVEDVKGEDFGDDDDEVEYFSRAPLLKLEDLSYASYRNIDTADVILTNMPETTEYDVPPYNADDYDELILSDVDENDHHEDVLNCSSDTLPVAADEWDDEFDEDDDFVLAPLKYSGWEFDDIVADLSIPSIKQDDAATTGVEEVEYFNHRLDLDDL